MLGDVVWRSEVSEIFFIESGDKREEGNIGKEKEERVLMMGGEEESGFWNVLFCSFKIELGFACGCLVTGHCSGMLWLSCVLV